MPTKKETKRLARQAKRKKRRTVLASAVAAALALTLIILYAHGFGSTANSDSSAPTEYFTGFPLTLLNGTTINTATLKGHPFVLWFVTTWCSSCVESQQLLASEYYPALHSKGILIVEVENYGDLGESGPTLLQYAQTYGGLNQPGWLIGTAPEWVTQKYNPDEYLDIFYLVNQAGQIVGENEGLGAYLGSIIQDFSATQLAATSNLTAYVGQPISSSLYSALLSASTPYTAPPSIVYPGAFKPISEPTISINGKPIIVYIGAEFCPYCAAARWPLIIALLRFGNFSGLEYMLSSSTDVYPNTPTFSFVQATYTSPYIVFQAFEYENRDYQPLQTVPANYSAVWQAVAQQGIPFVDFAGRVALVGAPYDPGVIDLYNWSQIVSQIQANTTVGATLEASANAITYAICSVDGGQPASVCSSQPVMEMRSIFGGDPPQTLSGQTTISPWLISALIPLCKDSDKSQPNKSLEA